MISHLKRRKKSRNLPPILRKKRKKLVKIYRIKLTNSYKKLKIKVLLKNKEIKEENRDQIPNTLILKSHKLLRSQAKILKLE